MKIKTTTVNGKDWTKITTSKGSIEFQTFGKGISISVDKAENVVVNDLVYKFNKVSGKYEISISKPDKIVALCGFTAIAVSLSAIIYVIISLVGFFSK